MKKMLSVFLLLIISFSFNLASVFADCSDCDPADCSSCGCVINSAGTACIYSNYNDDFKSCGGGYIDKIPPIIPKTVSIIYIVIQIAVPVVLVIMGSLDLLKGVMAQDEKEIKKGQQMFIKRLISGALVFFVFVIVKVVISAVADGTSNKIFECTECFVNNKCDV